MVVTDSDLNIIVAFDVTITHPSPSSNQLVPQPMLLQGYFASHRQKKNSIKSQISAIGAKFVPQELENFGSMFQAFSQFLMMKLPYELFRSAKNRMLTLKDS